MATFQRALCIMSLAAMPAPASAATSVEQTLIAMEKNSWDAWQRMDAGFWQHFLSDDHIELNAYIGMTGKADVIRGISSKACTVASYKVDNFKFRALDAKTGVLVYRAEQDTTCGPVKVPSPVWVTSVYQLRKGRWVNVLYEHAPLLVPPKKS